MDIQFLQHHLLKILPFFHCMFLESRLNIRYIYLYMLKIVFFSAPLTHMLIFTQFCYYEFIIQLEIFMVFLNNYLLLLPMIGWASSVFWAFVWNLSFFCLFFWRMSWEICLRLVWITKLLLGEWSFFFFYYFNKFLRMVGLYIF